MRRAFKYYDEEDERPPIGRHREPRGPAQLMMALAAINLMAAVALGVYVLNRRPAAPVRIAVPTSTGQVNGNLVVMEPLVVNLSGNGATRFLRVKPQLEIKRRFDRREFERDMVPVRDQLLLELSELSLEDTQGAEKKIHLQDKLRDRVNAFLGEPQVRRVMFTEFVVQ